VVKSSLPDFDFKLQFDIEFFFDSLPNSVNESHNIATFAPFLCDNEVGVFFADDRSSDLQPFKAGPVNQSAG